MELHKSDYWELVHAYLSGSISEQERAKLFQWLDEAPSRHLQLKELEKIWEQSKDYEVPSFDTGRAWEKLQAQTGEPHLREAQTSEPQLSEPQLKERKRPVLRRMRVPFLRYAASVVLLIVAGTLLYNFLEPGNTEIIVHTLPGETKQLLLPDSSRVFLNEGSSLSYYASLGQGKERRVTLKGEAFFEVHRDTAKRFIVRAGDTETIVLGTSFNIVSRDTAHQIRVSLLSGKVRFDPGEREIPQLLAPGEEIIYYTLDKSLAKRRFDDKNFLFWKSKKLEFTDERLEDVLALIGKYYDVRFEIQDQRLSGQRITSSFDHNNLSEVLQVLETLLNIRIEGTADSYIVTAAQSF